MRISERGRWREGERGTHLVVVVGCPDSLAVDLTLGEQQFRSVLNDCATERFVSYEQPVLIDSDVQDPSMTGV